MPWHQKSMKDATSCDKPGGAANRLRSQDLRIGQPTWPKGHGSLSKHLAVRSGDSARKTTQGSETSQYLEEKTSTEIPLVVASERGIA